MPTRIWNWMSCAAALLFLAAPASFAQPAVVLAQLSTSKIQTCPTAPPAATTITVGDPEIWLNLVVSASSSDVIEVDWLDPQGNTAWTPVQFSIPSAGTWCVSDYLTTATDPLNPARLVPGNWTIRILASGVLLRTVPFQIVQVLNLPDLTVTSFTAPTSGVVGGVITVSSTVQNIGTSATGEFQIEFFLSSRPTVTTSDIDTGWGCDVVAGLAPGATKSCGGPIGIPSGLLPGVYYIATIVDSTNRITESNKSNNVRVAGTITLTAPPASCTFRIGAASANFPAGAGTGNVQVILNTGSTTCPWTATTTESWIHINPSTIFSGNSFLQYSVDANTSVARTGTIQVAGQTFTVNQASVPLPDIVVTAFSAPTTAVIGSVVSGVITTVQNAGLAPVGSFRVEFFLSRSVNVTTSDIDTGWGCTISLGLIVGASATCNGQVGIPSGLAPGAYFIAAIADPQNLIVETLKSDNVRTSGNGTILLTGGCTIALATNSANFNSAGGTGSVNVTGGSGCNWSATTTASWLHVTSGSPGSGNGSTGYSVDVNSTGGSRTGTIQVATQAFSVTQAGGPQPPAITSGGVAEPWTYTKGIAPGTWVAIFGTNFMTGAPVSWSPQLNQPIATTLGGVGVAIDGIPAVLSYVSPTLLNALVPGNVRKGQISIVVTSPGGLSSTPFSILSTSFLPAIYANVGPGTSPPRFYVTAVDPLTGSLLGAVSADARVIRAPRPGDTIDLFAVGLGPTTPQFPTNTLFSAAYSLTSNFNVVLGGISLSPTFAALVSPGLYQVRIVIPSTMRSGDQPILLDFGSAQSAANVYLTIQP